MAELEAALAFVARREGRRAMAASRWAHVISFDLGWMPPAEARAFVARGVEAALLRAEGEELRLTVDPATVEVPRGFRPQPQPAVHMRPAGATTAGAPVPPPATSVDPFLDWVERLAAHSGADRAHVLGQVTAVQAQMGGALTALAAVLWLAARAGLDVRQAAASVRP